VDNSWTGFVEVDNGTGAGTVEFPLVNLCNNLWRLLGWITPGW